MSRWALVLLLLFPLASSQQNEVTRGLGRDIERYRQLLEERQAEQARLEAELTTLSEGLAARLRERDKLGQELSGLRQEQEALRSEVGALGARLEQTEGQITELGGRLELLKARLRALLVSLYKQRSRYASLLARSESFHDLQVKGHYLSLIADQDAALIDDLNTAVQALAGAQEALAAQLRELGLKEEALRATEGQLGAKRAELDAVIGDLEASREGQKALRLENLRAQERLNNSIAAAIRQRDEELARLRREAEEKKRLAQQAAEARERERLTREAEATEAAAALAAPLPPAEGRAIYPFPNPRLVSAYGEDGNFFIALRAQREGAAVQAVMSGVVQAAQLLNANSGYIVMIAHGADLLTISQNLQSPLVRVGEKVDQGQIIGYLGGGTLPRADTLQFFVGVLGDDGDISWVDPTTLLGLH